MKKLHISLLAIICAFVGTANAADVNVPGWGGYTDVASAWGGTANYTSTESEEEIETGLCTSNTSDVCMSKESQECGYVDEEYCYYGVKETVSIKNYKLQLATDTLFRQVLNEIEKDAQAQYNAKLTLEQNMCRNANSGGIMGRNDMASTYMWVKLKSRRVPKNYSVNGLKENEFDKSNDLYGSFCRARVTVQSDDPAIQRYIQENKNTKNWTTAYFAVGDVFTCGSWIAQEDLEKIATRVACEKAQKEGKVKSVADCESKGTDSIGLTTGQKWATAASGIGSAILGGVGMDLLQSKTGLGGLLNTTENKSDLQTAESALVRSSMLLSEYCVGSNANSNKFSSTFVTNFMGVRVENWQKSDRGTKSCDDLERYFYSLEEVLDGAGITTNVSKGWRVGADGIAAAVVGGVGAWAAGSNIKAANRQQFTAAQQEFMDNVGNHLYCFIGADEAGTYGDLIEISLD